MPMMCLNLTKKQAAACEFKSQAYVMFRLESFSNS